MEQVQWGKRVVQGIAGEIRRWRKERKMSAQDLSDACAKLGWPIARSVLSNLESGYRETITVPELYVIAQALQVPPLRLLLPLGHAESVETLPGVTTETTSAMRWLTGENPLPGTTWHGAEDGDHAVAAFQVHQSRVSAWETSRDYAQQIRQGEIKGSLDEVEQSAERAADDLKRIRHLMRSRGLTPPPLPASLAFVDGGRPA